MSEYTGQPDDQSQRPGIFPSGGNQFGHEAVAPSQREYQEPQQSQRYQEPSPDQYQQPQYQQPQDQRQPYGAGAPPVYGYPGQIVVQQAPSNGIGTAGFVTGLLGLIFCWVPGLGLVLGLLGVVLGGVGISTGHKKGAGTGLAIAGLVLGLISLIPSIIVLAAVNSVTTY